MFKSAIEATIGTDQPSFINLSFTGAAEVVARFTGDQPGSVFVRSLFFETDPAFADADFFGAGLVGDEPHCGILTGDTPSNNEAHSPDRSNCNNCGNSCGSSFVTPLPEEEEEATTSRRKRGGRASGHALNREYHTDNECNATRKSMEHRQIWMNTGKENCKFEL